jgi:hypothetical protein
LRFPYKGREVDGTPIAFTPKVEPWSEYVLGDGNILRVKTVVTKVFATNERSEDGKDPLYFLQKQTVLSIDELPKTEGN